MLAEEPRGREGAGMVNNSMPDPVLVESHA
jgi:hypothetical protein